jgi:hypothetical protein
LAPNTDETGRVVGYRNLSRIATTLAPILIRRDEATGRPYLHLPMPDADLMGQVASLLGALVQGVQKR